MMVNYFISVIVVVILSVERVSIWFKRGYNTSADYIAMLHSPTGTQGAASTTAAA